MIPYGRQEITQEDIDAVVKVLKSDFITQGPRVPEFEQAVAGKVGANYGVAVNSATSALHLACRALGVCKGDLVWTSSITFVASANCALYCGAKIDFVDIDPRNYNMSVSALETKLIEAKTTGQLPKVVIPVHMCGRSCDMESIANLARQYGFKVIEDAAHAIGGWYNNEPIGNCRYSDIIVFSFHPVKIITTAEGGMALTNNPDLAGRMALLRNHGITRDPNVMTQEPDGPWYYQQIDLGYNYRMTEIQAALGITQLQRLDEFAKRRNKVAKRYNELLSDLPVITPSQHSNGVSTWHLYIIRLQLGKIVASRRQVFEYLREKGIGVNLHYIPVYTHPYYRRMGFKTGMLPEADKFYQEAITLPLFPAITEEEQNKVARLLKYILNLHKREKA